MKRGVSLYLDVIRFGAAFVVFLEHLREHTRHSFNWLWQSHPFLYTYLDPYSLTAVIIFFVLSGYVIAHVQATRESTPLEFAASRFARLYSVVVPALLLVIATNSLEAIRYPTAFHTFEEGGPAVVGLRYIGTMAFVSHYWLWPDLEPPNTPFWTLSFEASYYVAIGIFVFAKGWIRYLGLAAIMLLAGPTMILLGVTWLLGYLTYRGSAICRLSPVAGGALWVTSAIGLLVTPLIEIRFRHHLPFLRMPDASVGALLASYAAALCFAANIVGFNAANAVIEPLLLRFAGAIRWFASMTFALYLFHMPILSFFTVYPLFDRSSPAELAVLFAAPLLVVATVGRFCEASKRSYKELFLWVWRHGWALRFARS